MAQVSNTMDHHSLFFVVGVTISCAKTSCCQLQFEDQPETHLSQVGGDDLKLML